MECIFCRLVKGEIPCNKVYEDIETLAFLDIAPTAKGHTLVIPKEHHVTIEETPAELLEKVAVTLGKVAKAVRLGTGAEGYTIQQANFAAGGQVVPHLHFHIVPRFHEDGLKLWPQGKYEQGEAVKYCEDIAKHL